MLNFSELSASSNNLGRLHCSTQNRGHLRSSRTTCKLKVVTSLRQSPSKRLNKTPSAEGRFKRTSLNKPWRTCAKRASGRASRAAKLKLQARLGSLVQAFNKNKSSHPLWVTPRSSALPASRPAASAPVQGTHAMKAALSNEASRAPHCQNPMQ